MMIDRTDNEIADLVEAVYNNPDKNFGHFKGGLKEAIRRLRGNTDHRLRDALTVALQGLGQLAKSGENRSRSRPSNAQLVRRCEQALVRVARVLEGHPTYIGEDGHVCLQTLPDKLHE